MTKERVLIAMSGGVDSTAAALLLQRGGYHVDGVMLRLHGEADENAETDARAAAAQLGVGFTLLEAQDAFRHSVVAPFIAEYCAGRTPNPCIRCNESIKFGLLMDYALSHGYDYLATGHYARVERDAATGQCRLLQGKDLRKDQSYVLCRLTQHQLRHLLLPLGEIDKAAARALVQEAGLLNADRGDSQDLCFIPDGDYVSFLEREGVSLQSGNFIDEDGTVLGQHRGLPCYTIGQGKGLGIALGRHVYVLAKNAEANTVTLGDNDRLFTRHLTAGEMNWLAGSTPSSPFRCSAKTRYSQKNAAATAEVLPERRLHLTFDEAQRAITPGQTVVLYDGSIVLGGGIIE
ncbi:MAG: tRNA 2-thiouridine(34) synthase MnmA [Oscillospiraceae bacterium]|nr:tRNA 2-thiouridine(34) synthase MnmA [Oscillospiraceae bacterium]